MNAKIKKMISLSLSLIMFFEIVSLSIPTLFVSASSDVIEASIINAFEAEQEGYEESITQSKINLFKDAIISNSRTVSPSVSLTNAPEAEKQKIEDLKKD